MNTKLLYNNMTNDEKNAMRESTVWDFRDEFNDMFEQMDSMFNKGNIEQKAYSKATLMVIHDILSDGIKGMEALSTDSHA